MSSDPKDWFRTLDLAPSATIDEVKRSYRELAKVWHPDRFAHDPSLLRKSHEKMKQLNEAYQQLCTHLARNKSQPSWDAGARQSTSTNAAAQGNGSRDSNRTPPPPSNPPNPAPASTSASKRADAWKWKKVHAVVTASLVAVVFLVIRNGTAPEQLHPRGSRKTQREDSTRDVQGLLDHYRKVDIEKTNAEFRSFSPGPNGRENPTSHDVGMEDTETTAQSRTATSAQLVLSSTHSPPTPVEPTLPNRTPQSNSVNRDPAEASELEANVPKAIPVAVPKPKVVMRTETAPATPRYYFTVGSGKDEVLTVQGSPDRFDDRTFHYGGSRVFFVNGRVTSWAIYYPPLKAKLLPTAVTATQEFFTVGSTKNDVLAAQGTPDRFDANTFHYGGSSVSFQGDRVQSWAIYYPPLKARLLPRNAVPPADYFTVGSTKDEVLAVQGSPDRFDKDTFHYGGSSISFAGDRVVSWSAYYPPLRGRLQPKGN